MVSVHHEPILNIQKIFKNNFSIKFSKENKKHRLLIKNPLEILQEKSVKSFVTQFSEVPCEAQLEDNGDPYRYFLD